MEINLVKQVLDSLNKNASKTFIVNKNVEYTYSQFFDDVRRLYPHIKKGRVLLKSTDKYFYALSVIACLFKHSLMFLSNKDSAIYDGYEFAQIIDDEFVNNALKNQKEAVSVAEINTEINDNDPMMVVLSSGTSLKPKPIVLSYKAVIKKSSR